MESFAAAPQQHEKHFIFYQFIYFNWHHITRCFLQFMSLHNSNMLLQHSDLSLPRFIHTKMVKCSSRETH